MQNTSGERNNRRMSNHPCKFFAAGSCRYGSTCMFKHNGVNSIPATVSNNCQNGAGAAQNGTNSSSVSSAGPSLRPSQSKLRAEAPAFVPKTSVAAPALNQEPPPTAEVSASAVPVVALPVVGSELCPYNITGNCWYPTGQCQFVHGEVCEYCFLPVMHPTDMHQRTLHLRECAEQMERDMGVAFKDAECERAQSLSAGRQCGVCMEVVMDKQPVSARRFGILPNCKHVFCLYCIRKWRGSHAFESDTVRGCPECRTKSDFVVPSSVWVDSADSKDALLTKYKTECAGKHCRYFKMGATHDQRECPFGNQCFYRHELPDGTIVPGDSPRTVRRRMQERERASGSLGHNRRGYVMWDFLTADDDIDDWFDSDHTQSDTDTEFDIDDLLDWDDVVLSINGMRTSAFLEDPVPLMMSSELDLAQALRDIEQWNADLTEEHQLDAQPAPAAPAPSATPAQTTNHSHTRVFTRSNNHNQRGGSSSSDRGRTQSQSATARGAQRQNPWIVRAERSQPDGLLRTTHAHNTASASNSGSGSSSSNAASANATTRTQARPNQTRSWASTWAARRNNRPQPRRSTGHLPATANQHRPSANQHRPSANQHRPSANQHRPSANQQQPGSSSWTNQQPGVGARATASRSRAPRLSDILMHSTQQSWSPSHRHTPHTRTWAHDSDDDDWLAVW